LLVVIREFILSINLKKIFDLYSIRHSSYDEAIKLVENNNTYSKDFIAYINECKGAPNRKVLVAFWLIIACFAGYEVFYLNNKAQYTNYEAIEFHTLDSVFNNNNNIITKKVEVYKNVLYLNSNRGQFKVKFDNKQQILSKLKSFNISENKIINKGDTHFSEISFSWNFLLQFTMIIILLLIAFGIFRLTKKISKKEPEEVSSNYSKVDSRNVDKDLLTKTSFKDIAGYEKTKREMQEIVDFFRSPIAFEHLGVDIPKNIILVGPPGTGKTQLARAVAVASKAEIFYASGSEFIEVYVGVGALRLRKLFDEAKNKTPSIIFIDEIDALAKKRSDILTNTREHDQTLNELLNLLDGFTKKDKKEVVFIAATNREDVIDPAVMQRMNRKIYVDLPTKSEIKKIIKKHTENKPFSLDKNDISKISSDITGFSGREICNLIKEASRQSYHRLVNDAIKQCKTYSNNNSFSVILPLNSSFNKSPVQIAGTCPKGSFVTIQINGVKAIQVADDDEDGIWVTLQGLEPGETSLMIYEGDTNNKPFSQISLNISDERISMGIKDIQEALNRFGITIPNIENTESIATELDEHVIGQKQAVQILSAAITAHYSHVTEYIGKKNDHFFKPNVLLIGQKYSGKTELSMKLAEILKVPYALIDARHLIYEHSVYTKEQLILKELLTISENNVRKAQYGIICIEKIDSLVNKFEPNFSFQDMISGLINGKTVEVPSSDSSSTPLVTMNTKDIFFILEGRFEGIENIIKTRIVKESIKINPPNIEDTFDDRYISEDQYHQFLYETNQVNIGIFKDLSDADKKKYLYSKVQHQDLVKYGLTSKLLKHLPVVGLLNDNNTNTIKSIVKSKSMKHLLSSYNSIASFQGKNIEWADEGIDRLIKVSIEKNIGFDGLLTLLNNIFIYILNSSDKSDKVTMNDELIEKVFY